MNPALLAEVQDRLTAILLSSFKAVQQCLPDVRYEQGFYTNDFFPLRAYATFRRGRATKRTVVISVDFHVSATGELRITSDVATDPQGLVAADWQAVPKQIQAEHVSDHITVALSEIDRFVREQAETIIEELEK